MDDADLRTYFGTFGTITEALVMMDQNTQRSRGFGFVCVRACACACAYSCLCVCVTGLGVRGAIKLLVFAVDPIMQRQCARTHARTHTHTHAHLHIYMLYTRTHVHRFVTFDNPRAVDAIMQRHDHTLKGKVVEIKRAFPRGAPAGGIPDRGRGGPVPRDMTRGAQNAGDL